MCSRFIVIVASGTRIRLLLITLAVIICSWSHLSLLGWIEPTIAATSVRSNDWNVVFFMRELSRKLDWNTIIIYSIEILLDLANVLIVQSIFYDGSWLIFFQRRVSTIMPEKAVGSIEIMCGVFGKWLLSWNFKKKSWSVSLVARVNEEGILHSLLLQESLLFTLRLLISCNQWRAITWNS